MIVHRHGQPDRPLVIAIHGGPGAAGSIAPVAARLGERFFVLEPWQRGASDVPLTVAQHVSDLRALLDELPTGARPALVGHSWGAMLTLIFAAHFPERVGPLAIICSGTFDAAARALFHRLRETQPYDYAPLPDEKKYDDEHYDARANRETWDDYLRLERAGVYPAQFAAIRSPVLMLHGATDPHPGLMTRATLIDKLPRLEYVEWARCGHEPWRETYARDDFYATLMAWLSARLA
jgi:pimeloyl-ACP methyl ester carboxylesterase